MKMVMHIDKSQVKDLVKLTSGTGTFKRTPALQAGYKTFDAMIVGGAGGRNTGLAEIHRGAGGGGGGSLRYRALIKDLPEVTPIGVGARGADGPATSDAQNGGSSYFGTAYAYGGGGANGIVGAPDFPSTDNDAIASYGGEGGGNSFGVGGGGVGGIGKHRWNGTVYNASAPTNGIYVDLGSGIGGGTGGGGGAGRSGRAGLESDPTGGSAGSLGVATMFGGGVIDSHYGGMGGGADIFTVTGVHEYYGGNAGGVVVIKLS